MVKQSIAINFMPGRVQPYLKASQGDTGERVFEIFCYTDDEPYQIPSNATVLINGNKPGNYPFILSCEFEGNKVTFDCADTMTDVCGQVVCELAVMAAGGMVQSANFILYVERQVIDTSTIPSSDYQGMIDILQDIQDATGETKADADRAEAAADRAEEAMAGLKMNSDTDDGIVPKGSGNSWKIYATNGSGVPSWNDGDSYRLRGITEIPANADLDEYRTFGNYFVATSAIAATIANAPIRNTFKLRVESCVRSSAYIRQTLLATNTTQIFVRVYPPGSGATWSDWIDITKDTKYSAGVGITISGENNTIDVKANSKKDGGYVAAGGSNVYKVWRTDESGNPAWRSIYERAPDTGAKETSIPNATDTDEELFTAPYNCMVIGSMRMSFNEKSGYLGGRRYFAAKVGNLSAADASIPGSGSAQTIVSLPIVFGMTAGQTLSARFWQSSGTTLVGYSWLRAILIPTP